MDEEPDEDVGKKTGSESSDAKCSAIGVSVTIK